MSKAPFDTHSTVAVGVTFDHHGVALVRMGAALAKSLGKELCIVHAVEPYIDLSAAAGPFVTPYPLWEALQSVENENRKIAERKLRELASTAAPEMTPRLVVTGGHPVEALPREAVKAGAMLLLVGKGAGRGGFAGSSTALSLVAGAQLPILALDTKSQSPLEGRSLRLLVADDLTELSDGAVAFAAALAAAFPSTVVHHVHASSMTEAQMRTAVEAAAAASRSPIGKDEPHQVYQAFLSAQLHHLKSRGQRLKDAVAAHDGVYTAEILSGGVQLKLDAAVQTFAPTLVVFGRHKAFHTKPFSLGRLPHRSMLAYDLPVAVVPKP